VESRFVGRKQELATIEGALAAGLPVVVRGEAGIGKTTLWSAALERSRERGTLTLLSRPTEAETTLAFAALGDLLDGVLEDVLHVLAPPRRHALEAALLLADADRGPDQRALALALVDALRALAGRGPLLVGLDDVQWLDASSAAVLGFALRRVPVATLVALRDGPPSALHLEDPVEVTLGPLSVGALQSLLAAEGAPLSRLQLRHVHELSGGNPFYALELARRRPGDPLPESLRGLVEERLARLSREARQAVAATAALALATPRLVRAVSGAGLDEALDEGVLAREGDRLRASHPLLAAGALDLLTPEELRALHARLAVLVEDDESRARHRAAASAGPDEEVAAALEAAADRALRRGALPAAAELLETAAQVTAEGSTARRRRLARSIRLVALAGDGARAVTMAEELVADSPPGAERATALVALGDALGSLDDVQAMSFLERALDEAGGDDEIASRAEQLLAEYHMQKGDVAAALAHAQAAVVAADRLGDVPQLVLCLGTLCHYETYSARITPSLLERAVELEAGTPEASLHYSPDQILGLRQMYGDDLDGGRARLERVLARAEADGAEVSKGHFLVHLVQLECRAGRLARADELAAELETAELADSAKSLGRALVDTLLGRADSARAAAERGISASRELGNALFELLNTWVLGLLELSLGRPAEAAAVLGPLPARLEAMGYRHPGVRPLQADAIEALVAIGELGEAATQLERLEREGHALDLPWALAAAGRCRGLLAAARGDTDGAEAELERALEEHRRSPQPLERARTALALGSVLRRANRRREARDRLSEALAVFDGLGAQFWAERAREELARIAGRTARDDGLTPSEQRVAELVAAGKTNREVAAELVVSERTVETHLTHVYGKLGVRSRTELARVFREA
jgi:DNA-binding CsgD family transcriptional regulator